MRKNESVAQLGGDRVTAIIIGRNQTHSLLGLIEGSPHLVHHKTGEAVGLQFFFSGIGKVSGPGKGMPDFVCQNTEGRPVGAAPTDAVHEGIIIHNVANAIAGGDGHGIFDLRARNQRKISRQPNWLDDSAHSCFGVLVGFKTTSLEEVTHIGRRASVAIATEKKFHHVFVQQGVETAKRTGSK